jgi:hypothetical protein
MKKVISPIPRIYPRSDTFKDYLVQLLKHAENQKYQGYCKFDALNSPIIERYTARSKFLRIAATQIVNRIPLPLRQITRVPMGVNPKGLANFIKARAILYAIDPRPDNHVEIERLVNSLLELRSDITNTKYRGLCWGYHFPWQSPLFFAERYSPNAIVTTFCGEALLKAGITLGIEDWIDKAKQVSDFLLSELPVLDNQVDSKCLAYVPQGTSLKVVNINAVISGFIAKLSVRTKSNTLEEESRKLIEWVVQKRTSYYCWYYTEPASRYVRQHDNYHTGGILDGLFDYMTATGDWSHLEIYMEGLKYYESELFELDGAPKWRNDCSYPRDIHGAAQGIITFCRASELNPLYLDVAVRIAEWTISNMRNAQGGFYFQQHRLFTWKIELMRWANSWMAVALAMLVERMNQEEHASST